MTEALDPNSPLRFVAGFLCVWIAACSAISLLGGWWALARRYASRPGELRKRWRFQSAMMRWMTGYGGCLHVGVTDRGLALSVLALFRPGHPPLSIPWEDIRVERHETRLSGKRVRLRFAKVPDVPLIIREALAREINAHSAAGWEAALR